MEQKVLRHFQFEIVLQIRFCRWAYDNIHRLARAGRTQEALYNVQSLLVAWANISKIMWPVRNRNDTDAKWKKKLERGKEIRESIAVNDDSILKNREIRNIYEHYDERLDEWYSSPNHSKGFADMWVGPINDILRGLPTLKKENVFRHYDPNTDVATFQGKEYHLRPVFDELARIYNILDPRLNGA